MRTAKGEGGGVDGCYEGMDEMACVMQVVCMSVVNDWCHEGYIRRFGGALHFSMSS